MTSSKLNNVPKVPSPNRNLGDTIQSRAYILKSFIDKSKQNTGLGM
jgi:hypothetical protein